MPGFVSPYATAVTGNRLRPFPSAPLRTARESFDLKRLASGLCFEPVPLRSFSMNGLVALLTDNQSLAAACGHPLDPGRFLTLSWSVQIRELADVVNLTGPLGPTELAFLSQKALHHLAPNTEDFLGVVVEDGVFLPTKLDAPEACHQRLLLRSTIDDHLQHLLGAVRDIHGLPVLSVDPVDGGLELARQRLDQRKLHDPMKSPKAMNVEGQEVVLDEAPIFRLVLGHDTEISIILPSSQPIRFAPPRVSGTFRPDDIHGDLQPWCAIDTATTAKVVLLIGVQGDDLVAEESCRLLARMAGSSHFKLYQR